MIDLHSHILFGLDDGPVGLDGSLELARGAFAAGTRTMVATPHIDSRWNVDCAALEPRARQLRYALHAAEIELELLTGAEIAIDRYPDLREHELEALSLGSGPYLLIECPLTLAAGSVELAVAAIMRQGRQVLLAHPERCPAFQRQPDKLRQLVEAGALCQLTAESLAGRFGRTVRRFAIELLRDGLVHDLASDAHDDRVRPPPLLDGLLSLGRELPGIEAHADWLTQEAPSAILAGDPLPPRPPLTTPARGGWRRR